MRWAQRGPSVREKRGKRGNLEQFGRARRAGPTVQEGDITVYRFIKELRTVLRDRPPAGSAPQRWGLKRFTRTNARTNAGVIEASE